MNPTREELLFGLALTKLANERPAFLDRECVGDAAGRKDLDERENYHCRCELPKENYPAPKYTVRAWRAVLTYLLRQREFLYE